MLEMRRIYPKLQRTPFPRCENPGWAVGISKVCDDSAAIRESDVKNMLRE